MYDIVDTSSTLNAIRTALSSAPESQREGLQQALLLIERGIPDLVHSLGTVVQALDNASMVVDKSEDEDYAYQVELELGRGCLERIQTGNYDSVSDAPSGPRR